MNNRKYLTSTGVLLKSLNEEPNNFVNQNSNMSFHNNYNQTSSQYNQSYQHQQNSYSNFQSNNNQMYNKQQYNPIPNPQYNVPDIMVLPNSMSQQRWPSSSKPSKPQNYQKHLQKPIKNPSLTKKTLSISSLNTLSNSSSVTELPETFGLPSNQTSKTNISMSKHTSSTNLEKQSNEILIDDTVVSPQKSEDIEIISEINTNQSSEELNTNLKNYLKNYSTKNLNLPVATKPQSNFISNFNLIDQLIKRSDFYTNKLKRHKPYSNVKVNQIFTIDTDDESDDEDATGDEKLKNKKVILIDDSNEEMHKPWITPDLIKLIKHRNLLQSKLQKPDSESADPELLKKFKNLRNKVTKLVKKARKDYLAKYIQESKENKMKSIESEKSTASTTVNTQVEKKSPEKETSSESKPSASTSNPNVNEITKKMTGSFLKDTNTLMMSLYTNYFNEYMQNYTKQQQQAQELASKAGEKKEGEDGLDSLQKQAAYYAQQQLQIQQQLEKSLNESAQQLIQEIAEAAAAKASQPFVLNQFSQQNLMHHHIHMGGQMTQSMMTQAPMMTLVPQPPGNAMSQSQIGIPPKGYY